MNKNNNKGNEQNLDNVEISYKDMFDVNNSIMSDCITAVKAVEGLSSYGSTNDDKELIIAKACDIMNKVLDDHIKFLERYNAS